MGFLYSLLKPGEISLTNRSLTFVNIALVIFFVTKVPHRLFDHWYGEFEAYRLSDCRYREFEGEVADFGADGGELGRIIIERGFRASFFADVGNFFHPFS